MGYFGQSGFENDDALDWLEEVRRAGSTTPLTRAFRAYEKHAKNPPAASKFSKAEIEENIQIVLSFNQEDPPDWWAKSGKPKKTLLKELEGELRDKYDSGRYLDEQYGPVENALAAAEIVAAWGGVGPERMPRVASDALATLRPKTLPAKLVVDAIRVVDLILRDRRYARMRRFYLDAFSEKSGGYDDLEGVKDLRTRLRQLQRTGVAKIAQSRASRKSK